jgi:hypothetical protein
MNITAMHTMGRKRPSTMGRSLHVTTRVQSGVDGASTLHIASAPGGLEGRGATHAQAMDDLNRQVYRAINSGGDAKGNL